tara:strand:+ start:797 stop:1438 length:642 start_codon:yes stop_codon:yes gene_type:complete
MKQLLKIFILLIGINLYSQEINFSVGSNFSDYSFYANENFSASGIGSYAEIGYTKVLGKKTSKSLSYSVSLNMNEYNASTGNMASYYEWQTNYIGVKNAINIPLITIADIMKFEFSAGINLSHILKGKQIINSMVYDISKNSEFDGINAWTDLGINLKFKLKEDIKLAIGYSISGNKVITGSNNSIILDDQSVDNVEINNDNIRLSLIYTLND